MSSKRAVFLNRDGVINPYHYNAEFGTVEPPATSDQFELVPGAAESIAELNRRDFTVIVVSNQPGIANGRLSPRILQAITIKMVKQLTDVGARVDDVLYCTHHPEAALAEYRVPCDCRKPKPGLLLRAARERRLDLAASFLVGDSADDILAGHAAGVTTILLGACGKLGKPSVPRDAQPDYFATDWKHAVRAIQDLAAVRAHSAEISGAASPFLPANAELIHNYRSVREAVEMARMYVESTGGARSKN